VLDALGERVLVVGTGHEAARLKLVVNTWMTTATVAANRTVAIDRSLCWRLCFWSVV
jgi:hypothetical protein